MTMDIKEYHIKQVVLTQEEVTLALASVCKLDPYKSRLEVLQNEDKSLVFKVTFQHEVKETQDGK
jgi:hypothetical protein